METTAPVPTHHAHYPGFSGLSGALAALSMSVGRTEVSAWAADLVALVAGDRLVDVGCGPGNATRFAAKRGAAVTGIDPADVMLRVARRLSVAKRVDYRIGRAEELPVPDKSATVVWTLSSVHHWADVAAALSEVRRVLTPGGRFVAIETRTTPGARGHASHGWTDAQAEAFSALCADIGFTSRRIATTTADRRPRIAVVAVSE
jgi:ubiquinone/menaquinone biosynthesis C-methylase UbiE